VWQALRADDGERQGFWRQWVQTPLTDAELSAVRRSVVSGRPSGDTTWAAATAAALGLRLTQRPRGRPRREQEK
jgi:hypothetical protein